jgi:uncharacterized protein with ParB-like and HNH nuclease domain/predicted transport protein
VKAKETQLLKFMQGTQQFIIPIYQRTYSWTRDECQQLWDDIVRAATDNQVSGHFVGSVVYVEKGEYHHTSVSELLVIDGQQRLTTISLLLAALGRAIEASGEEADTSRRQIEHYYLFNPLEEGALRYKVLLTQSDRETLFQILEGKPLPEAPSPRVLENYRLFEEQIKVSGLPPSVIFRGIGKLLIVDISLNREYDNPQLIFESLNSTGLALSQADLIRNYVLMGLESAEQTSLYRDHWYPMERVFGQAEYSGRFDRFMRDFLTVRTGTIPNIQRVYATFKAHMQRQDGQVTTGETVADIHRYARLWVRIAGISEDPESEVRRAFADINALRVEVAYPFLVELYADHDDGRLTRDEFVEILHLVESYVFRRAICAIPTNTLNTTFAGLGREIDKGQYLLSVKLALLRKDSYRRFPSDEEFRQSLVQRDVYNLRTRNYLLSKLENHNRKELVHVDSYTIEHVMPQNPNLSPEWQEELGPDWELVQERLLHTLGNLTLTGYNSELSDRPFRDKRDMVGGFHDSPLRLNHTLANRTRWNEHEILDRARHLADLAVDVWRFPTLPPGIQVRPAHPAANEYTLETQEVPWQPNMRQLFEQLRQRVLNLDASVQEVIRKSYIAYRSATTFLYVSPQQRQLRLDVMIPLEELNDPSARSRDMQTYVEVRLNAADQLDDVMGLVEQALERHRGDGDDDLGVHDLDDIIGDEVTEEGVRRMLTRIPVPAGQRDLYRLLYDAGDGWVALGDLAVALGRTRHEFAGIIGALGHRISGTPGLGRDRFGNKRGLSAVLDVEMPSGGSDWIYRMKPILREALEAEGLV